MTNYVIVTPVKDEEDYIEFTIKSVINQTIKPDQWLIVDDGSIDKTKEIILHYSLKHKWIKYVEGGDQGERKAGIRHLKAFYKGYSRIDNPNWDFLVKLDGDLSFAEGYFERCFTYFEKNPKLGIGGGIILNMIEGKLVPEKHPLFHVRGATKIYSRDCWDDIGGLIVLASYDTLDEIKANMLGYETQSFLDLKVNHHRYTGRAYGKWGNSVKNGLGDYISGYHPLFMLAKCLKRIVQKPYLVDALGLFCGYISGYVKGEKRVDDKSLVAYLRKQQIRCLTFRKSIWR